MRSIACALILMGIVTSPARAHDPSCAQVYNSTATTQGLPVPVNDGGMVLDDTHLGVSQAVLCAVDVKGRVFGPGVLSLYVYKGSPTNDPPSTLLAGPIDIVNPPLTSQSQVLHYELPPTIASQDLWIGVGWTGPDGAWVGSQSPTQSIGSSQDVWWAAPRGQTPGLDDQGTYVANTYLVVYGMEPLPAQATTWGELKATYR